MQHYSPARLSTPLLRVGRTRLGRIQRNRLERGIDARRRLAGARSALRDPRRLAFFTGRDQSQALTGWWAQQFGTPNFAAHGGFCSVNMAAAGLYTLRRLVLGVRRAGLGAHAAISCCSASPRITHSNPIKIGLGKLKGARRQSRAYQSRAHRLRRHRRRMDRHPTRHGRPVRRRPGPRAAAAGQQIDVDYLRRYTNARLAGDPGAGRAPMTGLSRATATANRSSYDKRPRSARERA